MQPKSIYCNISEVSNVIMYNYYNGSIRQFYNCVIVQKTELKISYIIFHSATLAIENKQITTIKPMLTQKYFSHL